MKKILSPEFRYVFCVYVSVSALLKAAYLLFHSILLHPWWNDNLAELHRAQTLGPEGIGLAMIAFFAWHLRTKKSAEEHENSEKTKIDASAYLQIGKAIQAMEINYQKCEQNYQRMLAKQKQYDESRKKREEET